MPENTSGVMRGFKLMQQYNHQVALKICYELQMLHFAYDQLCQLEIETCDIAPDRVYHKVTSGIAAEERRKASAWLECFLLHARVLRDFFANDPRMPDDVAAIHFVPQWSTAIANTDFSSTDKERLNKALAHLTTTRIHYDQSHDGWDVDSILGELVVVTKRFLVSLPADKTCWFKLLDQIDCLKNK